MRALALLASALAVVVAVACGSRAAGAPSAPVRSLGAAGSPPPASTTVAFPDLGVLVGTVDGDVYLRLAGGKPSGPKVHVCDGYIVRIEPNGPADLVSCIQGSAFAVFTYDHRTGAVGRVAGVDGPGIWTLQGDGILFVTRGSCAPAATDCASKLARRDLRTGAVSTIDERIGVVTDFRFTDEGPTVWRAEHGLGFVRPAAEAGTYLIRDAALSRFSSNRLVAGSKGRWLLESEETGSFNSGCCTHVLVRHADADTRLTAEGVENERAVAMLEDGRILAYRPDRDGSSGTMVRYAATGGTIERADRGAFTAFGIVRAAPDWVLGFEYPGAPSLTLRAYRVSDGAFASAPGGSISVLAALPAK